MTQPPFKPGDVIRRHLLLSGRQQRETRWHLIVRIEHGHSAYGYCFYDGGARRPDNLIWWGPVGFQYLVDMGYKVKRPYRIPKTIAALLPAVRHAALCRILEGE